MGASRSTPWAASPSPPATKPIPRGSDTPRVSILTLEKGVCWRATSCSISPRAAARFTAPAASAPTSAPGTWCCCVPTAGTAICPTAKRAGTSTGSGFRGPNVDARFRNDFFDDSREVFRVGVREEITALYDKAIEVAENERSSYQQYLAGASPTCCWAWRCTTIRTTSSCRSTWWGRSTGRGASCARNSTPTSRPTRWPGG